MRPDKVLTVAMKDLAEFRTNKYILVTLIVMPLIMAIVVPAIYLVPVVLFAPDDPGEPFDLAIVPEQSMMDGEVANLTFSEFRFENVTLTNCILDRCVVIGSVVNNSLVTNSEFDSTLVRGGIVRDSNLNGTTTVDVLVENSVRIGEEGETEELVEMFIDSLLMFFVLIPAIIPTVMASYSFVGEKLNKSLEPLLATPTTDLELLAGKVASIFIPTMAVTWMAFIPFAVMVNALSEPVLGYVPLPNAVWLMGVFLAAPLICLLSILANVLVSSRVSDVRASQQIGGLIVLPLVGLFVLILAGVMVLSPITMAMVVLLLLLVDAAILALSLKVFDREEILVRWK